MLDFIIELHCQFLRHKMTLLFKINGGSLQERHKIKRRKILSFWMPITNELEFLEAAFFFCQRSSHQLPIRLMNDFLLCTPKSVNQRCPFNIYTEIISLFPRQFPLNLCSVFRIMACKMFGKC